MASDGIVQLPPDSTGKKVDAASMDVGANTVYRQRITIADNTGTSTYATVLSSGPAGTEGGLVVRNIPSGTQTVAGTVSLGASTAKIGGTIGKISATATMVLAAVYDSQGVTQVKVGDSANSALRVNIVAGAAAGVSNVDNASYSTGAANFVPIGGEVDDTGTALITENCAGAARMTAYRGLHVNLRTALGSAVDATSPLPVRVEAISGTASVVLAAGAANIGSVNNISATVVVGLSYVIEKTTNSQVQVGDSANAAIRVNLVSDFLAVTNNVASASHGPKLVTCSTSAVVALVAAPGVGLSIYVTQAFISNASGTGTKAFLKESASANCAMFLASSGGGCVLNFDPPWKLSANTVLNGSVKPNASDVFFTVNFYVAA